MTDSEITYLKDQIQNSIESSDTVWWQWNIPNNRVSFHTGKVEKLGYTPEQFQDVGYEAFVNILHPDDYERTMEAMRNYLSGTAPIYQVDYRICRAKGGYTWYMDRGYALSFQDDGSPETLRGLVFELQENQKDSGYEDRVVAAVRRVLPNVEEFGQKGSRTLITVCSVCLRIALPNGEWSEITTQLPSILPGRVSHGICPTCIARMYPELRERQNKQQET